MKNYKFTINGNKYSVDIVDIEDNVATVEVNGTPYQVEMEMEIRKPVSAPKTVVKVASSSTPQTAPQAAPKIADVPRAAAAPSGGSVIKSPLPGVILDIFVKEGDNVKPGQHILMLEAMKMENNIDADKEGVIKEIRVQRNDSVMEGDVLVVIG
jgi:biotin carboxyl carrier protein